MIEFTRELLHAMQQFREHFGDIVPVQEIPASASTKDVVEAIGQSIRKNQNLLPSILGYGKIERDPRKDV